VDDERKWARDRFEVAPLHDREGSGGAMTRSDTPYEGHKLDRDYYDQLPADSDSRYASQWRQPPSTDPSGGQPVRNDPRLGSVPPRFEHAEPAPYDQQPGPATHEAPREEQPYPVQPDPAASHSQDPRGLGYDPLGEGFDPVGRHDPLAAQAPTQTPLGQSQADQDYYYPVQSDGRLPAEQSWAEPALGRPNHDGVTGGPLDDRATAATQYDAAQWQAPGQLPPDPAYGGDPAYRGASEPTSFAHDPYGYAANREWPGTDHVQPGVQHVEHIGPSHTDPHAEQFQSYAAAPQDYEAPIPSPQMRGPAYDQWPEPLGGSGPFDGNAYADGYGHGDVGVPFPPGTELSLDQYHPAPNDPPPGDLDHHNGDHHSGMYADGQDPFGRDARSVQPREGSYDIDSYGEDGDYDDTYADAEPDTGRSRQMVAIAGVLIVAAALGTGLAYSYTMLVGDGGTQDPGTIVISDNTPSKAAPDEPGGKRFANTDSKLLGRLDEGRAADARQDRVRPVSTLIVRRDGSLVPDSAAKTVAQKPVARQAGTQAETGRKDEAGDDNVRSSIPGMMIVGGDNDTPSQAPAEPGSGKRQDTPEVVIANARPSTRSSTAKPVTISPINRSVLLSPSIRKRPGSTREIPARKAGTLRRFRGKTSSIGWFRAPA